MPVKYYLHPNAISQNPDSHKAVIIPHRVHNTQGIIEEMLKKGTTLSEADILATMQLLFEVVTEQLQEGNNVNLPIVNLRPGISGSFSGALDSFDPKRHKTKATASIGMLLSKSMKNVSVEKTNRPLTIPLLSSFKDIQTGSLNDILTVGGIGELSGSDLNYNAAHPDEGIFFISTTNEEYKVTQVAVLHPKKLVFSIPLVPAGNYTLIVRKNFGNSGKTLRQGRLNAIVKNS